MGYIKKIYFFPRIGPTYWEHKLTILYLKGIESNFVQQLNAVKKLCGFPQTDGRTLLNRCRI